MLRLAEGTVISGIITALTLLHLLSWNVADQTFSSNEDRIAKRSSLFEFQSSNDESDFALGSLQLDEILSHSNASVKYPIAAGLILPSEISGNPNSCERTNCGSPNYFATVEKVRPVIVVAAEDVVAKYKYIDRPNWLIDQAYTCHCENQSCTAKAALQAVLEHKVKVFFGPVCEYSLASTGRLMGYFKIPLITLGGLAQDFGTKSDYPITRIGPKFDTVIKFYIRLLERFSWRKQVVLYQDQVDMNEVASKTYNKILAGTINDMKGALKMEHRNFNAQRESVDTILRSIAYNYGELEMDDQKSSTALVENVIKDDRIPTESETGHEVVDFKVYKNCEVVKQLRRCQSTSRHFRRKTICGFAIGVWDKNVLLLSLFLLLLQSRSVCSFSTSVLPFSSLSTSEHFAASLPLLSSRSRRQSSSLGRASSSSTTGSSAERLSNSSFPKQMLIMLPYSLNTQLENHYQLTADMAKPVIDIAMTDVEQKLRLLSANKLSLTYMDTECSDIEAPYKAVEAYKDNKIDVIIGLICAYALAPVARLSPRWKNGIPIISPGGMEDHFDIKREYKLLMRMNGSYRTLGEFISEIFAKYGPWHNIVFVFRDHDDDAKGKSSCHLQMKAIMNTLTKKASSNGDSESYGRPNKLERNYAKIYEPKLTMEILRNQLKDISMKANVIMLCASPDVIRKIMLAASDLGMTQSGEYVFFNVDILAGNNVKQPWYRSNDSESNNTKAKEAFRALKTITLRRSDTMQYMEFEDRVRKVANEKYNYENVTGKPYEMNSFISSFYDAVVLYALVLNETIAAKRSPNNGTELMNRMKNRTFEGINGKVTIDQNGDRFSDYTLLDLNPETNQFETVLNYFAATAKIEEVGKWHWVKGSPPKDTPVCGFDRSLCPGLTILHWTLIAFAIVFLTFAIISFIIYRHYKLEAELAAMTWRIKWEDLFSNEKRNGGTKVQGHENHQGQNHTVPDGNFPLVRYDSRLSLNKSICSEETIALNDMSRQIFTKTTVYKGTHVAIKKVNISKTKIDLSRAMLMEFKKMKDIQHDHVTRFIGACIDFPNYCIVTEYCPKGSLQDILENEEIKMDQMMTYSLIHDLVKGMDFIHSSDIRTHGNLKSSNCVVDSRFVLKVTDFGLQQFHKLEDVDEEENAHVFWKRKLWTAPELLRMEKPPSGGTTKGDVWSFAIILHEMSFRNGVFYCEQEEDISPQDVVERLKLHQEPPFRPSVDDSHSDDVIINLMIKCWAENPSDRPDFPAIRKQIRQLNRANETSNIVDNLLRRMEQYAENLEQLVQERTADYLEEKRKAEDLLYELLPKPVAVQLIQGESVTAESYEGVTIYFSDIVGFTSLSADSTPMEVVTLLNDLYTCFDSIIGNFDVYKVETIGDAYMCVSGLPVRNGNLHAREICRMALALLREVKHFRIRHRPDEQLMLRIGIHSGNVCAGVVGLKMPRYCLFGDTVNTASRMESNGSPLKIHVSSQTKELLDQFGGFQLECRGEVEMKGKGKQVTYWLLDEVLPQNLPSLMQSENNS